MDLNLEMAMGNGGAISSSTKSAGGIIRSQTLGIPMDKGQLANTASAPTSARVRASHKRRHPAILPFSPISATPRETPRWDMDSRTFDPPTPAHIQSPPHPHPHPHPDALTPTTKEFLPRHIRENVKIRMEQYDVWGPDVFAEAIRAVLTIILEDIFPLFKTSVYFSRMMAREKLAVDMDVRGLPQAHSLHVRSPRSQLKEDLLAAGTASAEIERVIQKYAGKHYTLEEILSEGMLYEVFLSHLEKTYSSDSLVCIRMVEIFKELIQRNQNGNSRSASGPSHSHSHSNGHGHGHVLGIGLGYSHSLSPSHSHSHSHHREDDTDEPCVINTHTHTTTHTATHRARRRQSWFDSQSKQIEAQAWELYLYFVAVGSAYEISFAPKCRDAVMSSLAAPHEHMFAELEASAMAGLAQNFRDYRNTVSYEHMGRRAVAAAQTKIHDKGYGLIGAARAMSGSASTKKKYPVHVMYSSDSDP